MASNHASCIQNGAISPCWSVQSGLRTRRGFFHVSTESTSPSADMPDLVSATPLATAEADLEADLEVAPVVGAVETQQGPEAATVTAREGYLASSQ